MSRVDTIPSLSVSRRLGQAVAEVCAGLVPIAFLLYALLASGCTGPAATPQKAPNLKGVVSQKISGTPRSAGNGAGSFAAMVVLENQVLPGLAGTAASYDIAIDGASHAVAGGQAIGAQTTDDAGSPWWVLMLAQGFAVPTESVMVALPASLFTAGSVPLDGYQAIAYVVDANGNPLAYTTSGTLTLTAAPTSPGGLVVGTFDATFAAVPASSACRTDSDCLRGEVCYGGSCVPADCSITGCPAGMACDASGACVPSGCATDADCGRGQACRAGQCVSAGCALTGCPAGTVCDAASGQCIAQPPACRTDADCAAGQVCVGGQCQVAPSGCQVTGCPAGYACDTTSGACVPSSSTCRTDSDCARGMVCEYGACTYHPSGCQATGCPAGYTCDAATGACVGGGTGVGSCFPQPKMGSGSFSGSAGEVPMCSAAGLSGLNGGPDAGLFDGEDENYAPATLFVIGDLMYGTGDTYLIAVLDQCPGAGTVLSAPATRFLVMKQTATADTVIQIQKTASAGTLSFTAGANGGLTAALSATFGTDTVTGEATVQ